MASWKHRQKLIDGVFQNTTEMYGSLQVIAGAGALGYIEALELPEDIDDDISNISRNLTDNQKQIIIAMKHTSKVSAMKLSELVGIYKRKIEKPLYLPFHLYLVIMLYVYFIIEKMEEI